MSGVVEQNTWKADIKVISVFIPVTNMYKFKGVTCTLDYEHNFKQNNL